MSIQKILVTGANGQLGWELSQLASAYPNYELVMVDRSVLDLSKPETINAVLDSIAPDAIINPAAYTGVDKAETEKELAYTINAKSVELMAAYAAAKQIPFISYSTDYVFTGDATSPYTTDTAIAPLNFYGTTKADGESLAFAVNPNTIIIRTS
jgi:dTDP-4-dehydrorhamnose reductase